MSEEKTKMEFKEAILFWQLEQKPSFSEFHEWLDKHNIEIPTEGSKFNTRWTVSTCEEMTREPGISGGRIEIWDKKKKEDYPFEYSLFVPTNLWHIIVKIIDELN